uniref:Auxin-responsive protein n=1 Tax=Rhizophora mucronata TaxID=61149 RepID=A0A2P2JYR4_RHIMU
MEVGLAYENDLNLKATELRLGLPGTDGNEEQAASGIRNNKRPLPESKGSTLGKSDAQQGDLETAPTPK